MDKRKPGTKVVPGIPGKDILILCVAEICVECTAGKTESVATLHVRFQEKTFRLEPGPYYPPYFGVFPQKLFLLRALLVFFHDQTRYVLSSRHRETFPLESHAAVLGIRLAKAQVKFLSPSKARIRSSIGGWVENSFVIKLFAAPPPNGLEM